MLGKIAIAAALVFAAALPAAAAAPVPLPQISAQSLLMPGVTYQRLVQITLHGPVVLDVVTAPRPDGTLYTLAPALSNGAIVGTEKLTDIEKDASAAAAVVGVNGDFFAANPGSPSGLLMQGGVLEFAPASARSSLGIAPNGLLSVAEVAFDGTWRGTGQRRQLDLNRSPIAGHTTLYTPAWGPTTPAESGIVADVIGTLPPLQPNHVITGAVTQVASAGGIPIPSGGAVLVARGAQAPYLSTEAPAGTTIEIRPTLTPDWSGMSSGIGGGPLLVAAGKPVFRAGESFGDPVLNDRARSAVAQLSDGRILLVTVEGGSLAYSAGMTNYELAVALVRLGAVTAMGLGTGAPAGMAFDGTLLTRPIGAAEAPLSDALLLSYTGVYAAPPSTSVVSPNGDGVDDTETFSVKLVRPSQVTVSLVAPDGSSRILAQGAEQPGVQTVQWNAETPAGAPEVEGGWKLEVAAADDRGLATTAERDFDVNETLGSLAATPAQVQLRPKARGVLAATFQLAHPARVTVTIEKRSGIVIQTLLSSRLAAGPQKVLWDGRTASGSLAGTSPYQVRVSATNSIGTVELVAPFVARRAP